MRTCLEAGHNFSKICTCVKNAIQIRSADTDRPRTERKEDIWAARVGTASGLPVSWFGGTGWLVEVGLPPPFSPAVVQPWSSPGAVGAAAARRKITYCYTRKHTAVFVYLPSERPWEPWFSIPLHNEPSCGERKAYMLWKFYLRWISTDSWSTSFCFIWDLWLFKCVMMRDNITRSCNEAIYIYSNSQHTHVSELVAALAAQSGWLKHKAWSLKCGHNHFS